MNKTPIPETKRQSIARLQTELDELRQRLGVSERGCVLYRADASYGDDEIIFVEADGFGGATLLVVEGNYPIDFFMHEERRFATEAEAVKAADSLRQNLVA